MLRHVAWFNEAPVEPRPEGGLTSSDATVCKRCLVPARALEELGIECSVFGNLSDANPADVGMHLQKLQTEIVVIGKMSGPSLIKLAKAAKQLGCYVVADFDAVTALSSEECKLAEMADQLVSSTVDAAASVEEQTGTKALLIPAWSEDKGDQNSPLAIAKLWLDGFRKLKMKTPACANTNVPDQL